MSNIKLVHSGGNSVSLTTPTSNPSSNITFKLPQADGTAGQVLQTDGNGNLTFVDPPGISMIDTWGLTGQKTLGAGSVVYMNTDFDRVTHVATGRIGGAMTKNGDGMFSFPSTGIYEIDFTIQCFDGDESRYINAWILWSTGGAVAGNFGNGAVATGSIHNDDSLAYATVTSSFVFDVTNTSTHYVRFYAQSEYEITLNGSAHANGLRTFAKFKKLAET